MAYLECNFWPVLNCHKAVHFQRVGHSLFSSGIVLEVICNKGVFISDSVCFYSRIIFW